MEPVHLEGWFGVAVRVRATLEAKLIKAIRALCDDK